MIFFQRILDSLENFLEHWGSLLYKIIIFLVFILFILVLFSVYQSNLPATNQQLLDAKSKCPQIADYLPRTIATQSSLDFYVQKCQDEFVISKQQAVLK